MKANLAFIILNLITLTVKAQTFETDKNLQYQFPFLKEKSPSNNHVTHFSYGILKYRSSVPCIEFDFKVYGNATSVRPDSMILITDNNKELVLKYPYRDTIYLTANGSLQISAIHFLKPDALDFLKQNLIQTIVVIIDNNKSNINLTKKNRVRLREMTNSE
jgi:hypothetical protein